MNTIANTNEVLTKRWLEKTFWRRFLNDDIEEVDMDEFYFDPKKVGIPAILVPFFRLSIACSVGRLTSELKDMVKNGEKVAIDGMVEMIRKLRQDGIEVVFLTNRPPYMWKETKKQIKIVFGDDDRNVILHMRHGVKKEEVIYNHLAYCSVGLIDDKVYNLAPHEGKLSILFTNGKVDTTECAPLIKKARDCFEVDQILSGCRFGARDTDVGPTLWVESQ